MWTASAGYFRGEVVFGPSPTKKWSGLETTSGMAEQLKRIVVFTSGGAGVCVFRGCGVFSEVVLVFPSQRAFRFFPSPPI